MIEQSNQTSEDSSYYEETSRWVRTEFGATDLSDARLDKRLISIIESFCSSPKTSIPQTSGTWDKTKATYRFLDNEKVSHENILQPHQKTTKARIGKEKTVLAIQDTTTLNYTSHPETEGLGSIGTGEKLRGMFVHTTLAITPERVPLGIIHQQTWIRPPEEHGKRSQRHKKPIEDKESMKWLNSFIATEKVQKDSPDTLIINIGDRESDVYELFLKATDTNTTCRLLVRAAWDRTTDHEQNHLWSYMQAQPIATTLEIIVPRKKKKRERVAKVEIRFAQVTLNPPRRKSTLKLTQLWAIYVNEPSPPHGEEPLSWMLLTTLSVSSLEEAIQYVQYYAIRFSIELFHKILKSGCRIEKHQLKTADRLRRCLAIDSIVAWRIMFLTMVGRNVPDLPCTVILKDHEWKSLYCFVHKTQQPPDEPLSLQEAVRLIARLGGFLGRKRDGHPGVQTLWRGMKDLTIISTAWITFGPETPQNSRDP